MDVWNYYIPGVNVNLKVSIVPKVSWKNLTSHLHGINSYLHQMTATLKLLTGADYVKFVLRNLL